MAVTLTQDPRPGQILRTAKFTATADNDVLMAAGTAKLILAAYFHGAHLTALNKSSGADESAYPFSVSTTETVCATSDGVSGDVTIVYVELPVFTDGVSDNQLTTAVT